MTSIVFISNLTRDDAGINNPFIEGENGSILIKTDDVAPNSEVFWSIRGIDRNISPYTIVNTLTENDFSLGNEGKIILDADGSFKLPIAFLEDNETEGQEQFYFDLFSDSERKKPIAAQLIRVQDSWLEKSFIPEVKGISGASTGTIINVIPEGDNISINFRSSNWRTSGLRQRRVYGISFYLELSGAGIDDLDFHSYGGYGNSWKTPSGNLVLKGAGDRNNLDVRFLINAKNDNKIEGEETFTVNLYSNDPANNPLQPSLIKPFSFTIKDSPGEAAAAPPAPAPAPAPASGGVVSSSSTTTEPVVESVGEVTAKPTSTEPTKPTVLNTSPSEESTVLGIQTQNSVITLELTTPLILTNEQITQAVVGTPQSDVITGTNVGEAIAGGVGKDEMTGGGGADAFIFETPGEFGKQKRDTITDFNPEEGDKVTIASDAFDGINKIKFKAVNGKEELINAASSKKIFIYNEKKGMLYFNENGKKDGFGDGGEFAKLLGAPDLGKEDFVLA
jgi:hypothetical protein